MNNPTIHETASQKAYMANILFWLFVTIFTLSAVLAFCVLIYVIFVAPETAKNYRFITDFAWALWGGVLAQVVFGVFALYKNLFSLTAAGEISDLSNTLSEVIDGLESNGIIHEEIAAGLREQYADRLGTSGSTRG